MIAGAWLAATFCLFAPAYVRLFPGETANLFRRAAKNKKNGAFYLFTYPLSFFSIPLFYFFLPLFLQIEEDGLAALGQPAKRTKTLAPIFAAADA